MLSMRSPCELPAVSAYRVRGLWALSVAQEPWSSERGPSSAAIFKSPLSATTCCSSVFMTTASVMWRLTHNNVCRCGGGNRLLQLLFSLQHVILAHCVISLRCAGMSPIGSIADMTRTAPRVQRGAPTRRQYLLCQREGHAVAVPSAGTADRSQASGEYRGHACRGRFVAGLRDQRLAKSASCSAIVLASTTVGSKTSPIQVLHSS